MYTWAISFVNRDQRSLTKEPLLCVGIDVTFVKPTPVTSRRMIESKPFVSLAKKYYEIESDPAVMYCDGCRSAKKDAQRIDSVVQCEGVC